MLAWLPVVEIAYHRYAACIRRPDREMRADRPVLLEDVSAQLLINPVMVPLSQEVEVIVGEKGGGHCANHSMAFPLSLKNIGSANQSSRLLAVAICNPRST